MNEIFEEHLKDAIWIAFVVVISITSSNLVRGIGTESLNDMFDNIMLVIEKHIDLSVEYGSELTISMPSIPLFNYSITLNDNECAIWIQGLRIFKRVGKYNFSRTILKPGKTYSIRVLNEKIILTER